ncbi:hypothetical protein ABBQ38_002786 [Trebouxia sp. C0009 RCD-2024]
MTAIRLRLLQYNVGSHSRKGEVIKQQLVQTALQQGLCDVALVHGCTGIHEPVRTGVGAVYQAATSTLLSSGCTHSQAGTMLCYTADRFRVRQLSSTAEDLPGFAHSIVLVQETNTSTSFITILLASEACTDSASDLARLWNLMKELSTQCPVLAAGDCRLSFAADRLCSDSSIQVQVCQPVQNVTSISQSFFATAGCSKHQIQIRDVESLLARPAAASAQYTQNAHTATCYITWDGAPALGPPTELTTNPGDIPRQGTGPSRLTSGPTMMGSSTVSVAAQLGELVNAASMEAAETVCDIAEPCHAENTQGVVNSQRPLQAVPIELTASCSSASHSCDTSVVGKGTRKALPAPLTISCQTGGSEIEPKPPTPAHGKLAGRPQLTQTSSGNFCLADADMEAERGSLKLEEGCSTQPQTPGPFRLQPKPTGRQAVDINTLRIMQLRRSISELSASNVPPASEVSAEVYELNAMLSQQRLHQQAPQESADVTGRLSPEGDLAGMAVLRQQAEEGASEHLGRCSDTQVEGLYAAAKQTPGELLAAWQKYVQQPGGRKTVHKQGRGRSREDRMSSPGRLLKCLQSRTDSDVEAEMQAMHFKH